MEYVKAIISLGMFISMLLVPDNENALFAAIFTFALSLLGDFIIFFDKDKKTDKFCDFIYIVGMILSILLIFFAMAGLTNWITIKITPYAHYKTIAVKSTPSSMLKYDRDITRIMLMCYIVPTVLHLILAFKTSIWKNKKV